VSNRVGPLLIAIASVTVRLAGQPAAADLMAVGALFALTWSLERGTTLQAAARVVYSCNHLPTSAAGSTAIVR
jgi:cytosine/adenosine deaminase-related metal-dependent hydrolase